MWILIVVSVAALWGIGTYNNLVKGRIHVDEGFSGVDVQLKRRHDLIPNIVETVKGYAAHEKNVLEDVTRLRGQVSGASTLKDRANAENHLSQALRQLFAVVENYPNLLANQSFLDLQKNLQDIENDIQLARRYYNGTVRNYNIQAQSFPNNLLAGMFHFEKKDFFEVMTSSEREVPEVKI
jgi:LemA protein